MLEFPIEPSDSPHAAPHFFVDQAGRQVAHPPTPHAIKRLERVVRRANATGEVPLEVLEHFGAELREIINFWIDATLDQLHVDARYDDDAEAHIKEMEHLRDRLYGLD